MENRHKVHNLVILDESGSMTSIKNTIIQGFNEIVQTTKGIATQYPEQEHFISFVTFNGLGIRTLHFCEPVEKLNKINAESYQPDASTPLYDAMGFSIGKLRKELVDKTDYNVLVTILTDGEENASKEFSGTAIKKLVEELTEQNWTFTYIGTDHDVEKFAISISIRNTMKFTRDEDNMYSMFAKEKYSRENYSKKIRNKEDTRESFYEDDEVKPS